MRKKIEMDQIYQAALSNFARYGFKKTTLDDIAQTLGVTKSNLYLYTSNKHALYKEAVAYALRLWQNRVRQAIDPLNDPQEKLITLCHKAFEYLEEDNVFCEILRKDPEIFPFSSEDDPYREINMDSIGMLKSIIQDGKNQNVFRNVDVENTALVFFSIYKMFIIQTYIKNENPNVSQVFDQTVNLLTTGLFVQKPE